MSKGAAFFSAANMMTRWLQTDASNKQGEPPRQPVDQPAAPQKKVWVGQSICDQVFKEGVIKVEIEFEEVDWRCMADIILQYDPSTQDMLSFSLRRKQSGG